LHPIINLGCKLAQALQIRGLAGIQSLREALEVIDIDQPP
jgi:hypothetical protein